MNNLNDTNNFMLSASNETHGIGNNGNSSIENLYDTNLNKCSSLSLPGNNMLSNTNEVDFASLLLNINPNDYMLPTINFNTNNIGVNGPMSGCSTSVATNSSIGGGNWEWSAFNSGMVSAASVDCGNNSSDHTNSMYQLKNLSNLLCGIGTTNSKGNPIIHNGNIYPPNNSSINPINNNSLSTSNQRTPVSGGGGVLSSNNQIQHYPNNINQSNRQSSNLTQIDNLIGQLNSNVSKISNYEIDAQRAYSCLPQAINLLNNASDNEATRSAYLIYLLSKKEACRYVLCGCANLSETLVNSILRFQNNPNVIRYCTAVIYHLLSSDNFINQYISTPNSIKVICDLTVSTVEATAFYAVATIHTLLVKFPDLRNQVLATNCFDRIVPLLRMSNFKFVTLVADVLHFLTIGNIQIQNKVVATGLHAELVHILKTSKFEKLLFTVCRFIKTLSTNNTAKIALIQLGISNVLTELLLNKSRRLACTSLWALRNFSDVCINDPNLKELLLICIRFILSQIGGGGGVGVGDTYNHKGNNNEIVSNKTITEPSLVACAVGIIANLTCNNQENKEILVKHGGLEALVTLCANANHLKDIIEPTMCALRHITSQHKFIGHTTATLRSLNTFPLLSNCLNLLFNDNSDDFFPQLKKITMSVISNIVINDESSLIDFILLQIPQKTIQILRYSIEMVKQIYSITSNNSSQRELSKQISLYNKLIEDSVVLIFIFVGSCNSDNISIGERDPNELINSILTPEFLDILTQLLFSDNGGVLSCVMGIFSAISKTPGGMSLIYKKYFSTESSSNSNINYGNSNSTNDSIGKIIINQLISLANSTTLDNSIKSAANSLINNWSNYFNSCSCNVFSPAISSNTNTMQNLNNLGMNPIASQNSPYTQHSHNNTPTHYSIQQNPTLSQNPYNNDTFTNHTTSNFYNIQSNPRNV